MHTQLNINFTLKPEMPISEAVRFLVEFKNQAESQGLTMAVKMPVIPHTKDVKEVGPYEAEYISQRGLQRMKVPSTWHGTREEYAKTQLHGIAHMVDNEEHVVDESSLV